MKIGRAEPRALLFLAVLFICSFPTSGLLAHPTQAFDGVGSAGPKSHARSKAPLPGVLENNVRAEMDFLASDAMQGRGSGTQFELITATYIASQLRVFGIQPAGDPDPEGKPGFIQSAIISETGADRTWNVIGVLRGTSDEAILLTAHMDHLGTNPKLTGDQIYNGADDDASGTIAVLELARALGRLPKPHRTIYFVLFGSEEPRMIDGERRFGQGATYFLQHSPVPLDKIAANLEFEMIGRPDGKVPAKTLWLTGFGYSNLGPELAAHGAHLVNDPHPKEQFFTRSDNYVLALKGVVAHTVSSFGLHSDYHRPSDDISHIDFPHLTESINSMVGPVIWLVNSEFKPAWNPGKKPAAH